MDVIIKKIQIEKFYCFEEWGDGGLPKYFVIFTYRVNKESPISVDRNNVCFNSACDETYSKLLRTVLLYKVYEEKKNNCMKLIYEAETEKDFKYRRMSLVVY